MAVYCISYDLPSNNYEPLIEAIKSYGNWWHQSESTWFIETNQGAKEILDHLKNYCYVGDKLIVVKLEGSWWAVGHTEDEYNWMRERKF